MCLMKFYQTFKKTPLKPDYWGELYGIELELKDAEGNSLTFYKSDYYKFKHMIKEMHPWMWPHFL